MITTERLEVFRDNIASEVSHETERKTDSTPLFKSESLILNGVKKAATMENNEEQRKRSDSQEAPLCEEEIVDLVDNITDKPPRIVSESV